MTLAAAGRFPVLLVLVVSLLMLARPQLFFGSNDYDAHDPRTVRFFGAVGLTLSAPFAAIYLYQIVSE